jgi:hypothetical protein
MLCLKAMCVSGRQTGACLGPEFFIVTRDLHFGMCSSFSAFRKYFL